MTRRGGTDGGITDPAGPPGTTTVGIIGVGKMGLPIARNLIERGFAVTGYRRSGTAELEATGGTGASSPAEVAAAAEVIVTILPGPDDLDEVVLGPAGTLSALRPGTVHVEMSTIDVDRKARVRDAVVAAGGSLLDCPMSGTPAMVGPRRATTFVSGPVEDVERVRAVLDAISGPWVRTGAFGTGARMKYVANLLVAVHTAAAAEALGLAQRLGLDPGLVQATLDDSIASSAIWRVRGPMMRERAYSPALGPIETLIPVLDQIAAGAAQAGVDLPVFAAARGAFDRAVADGWGDLDVAAVHEQVLGRDPRAPREAAGR